jgi:hypothetical protein
MTFVALLIAIGLWVVLFAPKKRIARAPETTPETVVDLFVPPDIETEPDLDPPAEPDPPAPAAAPSVPQARPRDAWPAQFNRTLYGSGLCSPRRSK